MDKLPKPGDRVRVDFGGFLCDAEVLRVSDLGGGRVFLRVELEGPEHPEATIDTLYPLASVEAATAV
jgi:hypothetical protein